MKRIARTGVLAFSLCLITACVICNSCGTAWNARADMEHEPDADTAGNDMAVTGNDTLGAKRLSILNRMDSLLAEYLAALDGEPAEIQKENVDFMIDGCDDPGIKRDVALKIYDHFRNSRIMGAEGIAVYLTDTRFSTGEIKMRSDSELAAARIFAEFNRNSLIGNPAPRTALTGLNGETAVIPDDFKGNYTVIYFYDDGCPVCMIESARLKHFVENGDGRYGLNLLAVYTGQDGAFTLYEDEGTNYNYEKGQYALIPFAYDEAKGELTLGERRGGYPGMLQERTFNIVKVTPERARPFDLGARGIVIKYDGRKQTVKL